MVLLFQAQLFVVVTNFVLCLLCLVVVNINNVVNCTTIVKKKCMNVVIISIYLGIVFFHVIPEAVRELINSNNVVFQHVAGICLAIGFMGSILVYRQELIPIKIPKPTETPRKQVVYPNSMVIPQLKYAQYYDSSTLYNKELDRTDSLTIDPSLYYPQYEWNNVPDLHYHPVHAVTQLENALATTYPFMPQKQESIMQPYLIPRYIETDPQLQIQELSSMAQDDIKEQSYGTNALLPQSYKAFLCLFIFHSIFLGVTLSIEKTVHGVAFISPAITICQTLQFIALIVILKEAQPGMFISVFALHVFPIVVLIFIFLQQSGIRKEEWENEVQITLAVLLLLCSGYLLFWCATYLHHSVEKTPKNIAISCSTLVLMYILSLFEKTW